MRTTPVSSSSTPRAVGLVAVLTLASCGRTGLDVPVAVTGTAGRGTGSAGVGAGTAGQGSGAAGTIGEAGSGAAGTVGEGGSGAAGSPATCVEGTTVCASATTARLCSGGVLSDPFACPMACINGICAECVPGTATCISANELEVCSNQGILADPTPCPGGCKGSSCVGCLEGDTRCASHEGQQTCKGGQWLPAVDCPFVCVGKACGQNPKKVFVTSNAFVGGDLGGLTGADALCQKSALVAGFKGTYLAWLSDSTGSPIMRFAEDGGPYQLVDGTIVANNWTDLTSGTLRHAIDVTEFGGSPPVATVPIYSCNQLSVAWSDTTPQGALKDAALSCGDWSDLDGSTTSFGNDRSTTESWSDGCQSNSPTAVPPCGAAVKAALYCFQQ